MPAETAHLPQRCMPLSAKQCTLSIPAIAHSNLVLSKLVITEVQSMERLAFIGNHMRTLCDAGQWKKSAASIQSIHKLRCNKVSIPAHLKHNGCNFSNLSVATNQAGIHLTKSGSVKACTVWDYQVHSHMMPKPSHFSCGCSTCIRQRLPISKRCSR